MMLFVDGSEISALTLALGEMRDDVFFVAHEETVHRTLGDELPLLQMFLEKHHTLLQEVDAFGVVCGPGSAGALRSTLSLINAVALGLDKRVFSVVYGNGVWKQVAQEHPYALPVYDRAAHTTVSKKDALKRAL